MERVNFKIPKMYGDHHVIAVREVLASLPGVEDILASAAFREVEVTFDPTKINQEELAKALDAAGYAVGDGVVPPELAEWQPPARSWDILGQRPTQTNPADIALSGEFRKY